jgi:hypothetical protein
MINKLDTFKCENCGSHSIVAIDGVPTCENCGTKYPEIKKDIILEDVKDFFRKPKGVLTKRILIILFVLWVVWSGVTAAINNTPILKSDGIVQSVNGVVFNTTDVGSSSNDKNDTKINSYYSTASITFDVQTNGTIYNVTQNVKFYNGAEYIGSDSQTSSQYSNGVNDRFITLSLPQKNSTITDVVIEIQGLDTKGNNATLFTTGKINVGSHNIIYTSSLNPNYIEPKPVESESISTSLSSSSESTDSSGNFNGYKYCYSSKKTEVYHTRDCGHLPQPENRIYTNTIPSNLRLCKFCAGR